MTHRSVAIRMNNILSKLINTMGADSPGISVFWCCCCCSCCVFLFVVLRVVLFCGIAPFLPYRADHLHSIHPWNHQYFIFSLRRSLGTNSTLRMLTTTVGMTVLLSETITILMVWILLMYCINDTALSRHLAVGSSQPMV